MITAILLSGGTGRRMQSKTPKQYLPLSGKPMALHSFELFVHCPLISEIVVVCHEEYRSLFPHVLFAEPGARRQDSLYNGTQVASEATTFFLVHDAARPLLRMDDLEKLIDAGLKCKAATLATAVKSTIKKAGASLKVEETIDRSSLFEIQTPQMIQKELLFRGFEIAHRENLTVTDDVSLVELFGHPVQLVLGSEENIKITTPKDLIFASHACQI